MVFFRFLLLPGAVAWILLDPSSTNDVEKIELSGGAHVLIMGTSAILNTNNISDDGTSNLYIAPSQKLQINDLLAPCTKVFKGGELILSDSHGSISVERSLSMYGTLSLEGNPHVYVGEHSGVLTMFPGSSPNNLTFGELTVKSTGSLRLLNYDTQSPGACRWFVQIRGSKFNLESNSRVDVSCPLNLTADQLLMGQNSEFNINGNGSVSTVLMDEVSVDGKFHPQVLSVGIGWKKLTVSQNGELRFAAHGDLGVDALSISGKLLVEGTIFIRGRDPAVTRTLSVGSGGRVEFDLPLSSNLLSFIPSGSQAFSSAASMDINGTSRIHADNVEVSGTWLTKKLVIEPAGWESLTVRKTGHLEFTPVGPYQFNTLHLNGFVKAPNEVDFRGLSEEKIRHFEVESDGVVSFESTKLSSILSNRVTINGTVRVGNLSIGSGWEELNIPGSSGKFYFETDEPLNIKKIQVSGLVQTNSPLGPNAPLTGSSFTVESGGQVNMHYQGPVIGVDQGAINSTIYMSTVQVDGTFQAGSLYIETNGLIVGPMGKISVDGGGSLGGEGLGAGTLSSSGGSGASHGGRGGRGVGTRALKLTYGSIFEPGNWGSGGGMGSGGVGGGRGGGRIELIVNNTLEVNGVIQMNGLAGQVSVWME